MAFCGVRPNYSVRYYRPDFFKLVRWKNPGCPMGGADGVRSQSSVAGICKAASSLARARSTVLQLALCNDWDFFFTGTLNPAWHERDNLMEFRRAFAQFIRDARKRYGVVIRYVFVAERHRSGAWHLHGLLAGLPRSVLSDFVAGVHPVSLVGRYLNWPDYASRFGFCSLGVVRNAVATAFYLSKYLSKDLSAGVTDLGAHTYTCSRGLARAVSFGSVYGVYPELDCLCTTDCRFCSTGYVAGVDWAFWAPYCAVDGMIDMSDIVVPDVVDEVSVDCVEWVQMVLWGFGSG